MGKVELKDRMEYSDVVKLHEEYYFGLVANRTNVRMLAKRIGYVKKNLEILGKVITLKELLIK